MDKCICIVFANATHSVDVGKIDEWQYPLWHSECVTFSENNVLWMEKRTERVWHISGLFLYTSMLDLKQLTRVAKEVQRCKEDPTSTSNSLLNKVLFCFLCPCCHEFPHFLAWWLLRSDHFLKWTWTVTKNPIRDQMTDVLTLPHQKQKFIFKGVPL